MSYFTTIIFLSENTAPRYKHSFSLSYKNTLFSVIESTLPLAYKYILVIRVHCPSDISICCLIVIECTLSLDHKSTLSLGY
ncbi:hypothetical protein EZV62_010022 [Acer yangbiense]|uniref:Uncharacterized protein n=1 Tax=Acer yangbiense TaxID=1000413 RepID=A0A5C7I236_9ROSI|nr:hypothetical protein EZV62_010022 [Acer yangbiense]